MEYTKFTNEQLMNLLEAQEQLNIQYTGNEWAIKVPTDSFLVALQTEVSEYLESAPRLDNWKWWKKNLENDTQNMVIETIDVLHFSLSLLIKLFQKDEIIYCNEYCNKNTYNSTVSGINNSLGKILTMNLNITDDTPDFNYMSYCNTLLGYIYDLINTLAYGCDRTLNEIYKGYFKKNKLNSERIEGGYMEGNYTKIDETGQEDNRKLDV